MRDDYPSVSYSIDIILTKNNEKLSAQRTLYGTTLRSRIPKEQNPNEKLQKLVDMINAQPKNLRSTTKLFEEYTNICDNSDETNCLRNTQIYVIIQMKQIV